MPVVKEDGWDDFFDNLGNAIEGHAEQSLKRVAGIAKGFAYAYSSGGMTAFQRQLLDYPFATRHGTPKADVSIINVGAGDGDHFRDHWKIASPGGEIVPNQVSEYQPALFGNENAEPRLSEGYTVYNDSSVAPFLQKGTPAMFARPVDKRVMGQVELVAEDVLKDEMQKFEKNGL